MEADRVGQSIASIFSVRRRRGGRRHSLAERSARWGAARASGRAVCLLLFAAPVLSVPAPCQEPAQAPTQSVVEAAQQARERESSHLTKAAKVITDDDLAPQLSLAGSSALAGATASNATSNAVSAEETDQTESCQNPAQAEALTAELQGVQDERDQIQSELSYQPPVISDNDLDLQYYKPGNSGLNVGSLPTLESQPEAPARVAEVTLDARIASLKKALLIACESPEKASIQRKLDAVEEQLKWAQRQFALDQSAFYISPNYATDTAGKARLDAEQQSIDALQSEKDLLSDQLAATNTSAPLTQD
jgi:hypothetical protein